MRDAVAIITEQVKKLRLANITASWSGTEATTALEEDNSAEKELEQLALSLREKSKIISEKTPAKKEASALRNTIVSPVKPLTPEKDSALRNFLDNRPLSVVKTAKPASPSKLVRSSPVQVPSSKLAALLKDATPTPPKLSFVSGGTPISPPNKVVNDPRFGVNTQPPKAFPSFNPAPVSVPEATPASQLTTAFSGFQQLSAVPPPQYEAISPPASPNPAKQMSMPKIGFGFKAPPSPTSSTGSLLESLAGKSSTSSTSTLKAEPVKLLERLSQPLPVPSSDSVKTGFSFASSSSSPSPFEGVAKSGSSGSLFGGSAPKSSSSLFGSSTVTAAPKAETAEASKPSESSKVAKNTATLSTTSLAGGSAGSFFGKTSTPVQVPAGISITKMIESSSTTSTTTTAAVTTKPTAASSSFSFSTASSSAVAEKTSSSSSLFGAASSTASSSASPFGGSAAFTTPSSTAPKTASVFGGAPSISTTKASVFGGTTSSAPVVSSTPAVTSSTPSASVFGGATSSASVFGGSSASAPSSAFGGATTTTKASVFGGASSSTNSSSVL